jgi:C4-dicarboxylate transporter DctQ subunit
MQPLSAVFRLITRAEALCLQLGILGIAASTIGNVLSRALTGDSVLLSGELNRFLIVWVTFIGIGYGASTGRHIRMTALYDALGPRAKKAAMLVICAGTSALLFAFAWLALEYVLDTVKALGGVSPVLRVPLYWVYMAAPLGLFTGAVQYLLAFAQNLTSSEVYVAFGKLDGYEEPPPADM